MHVQELLLDRDDDRDRPALLQLRLPEILAGFELPGLRAKFGECRAHENRAGGKTGEAGQRGTPGREKGPIAHVILSDSLVA